MAAAMFKMGRKSSLLLSLAYLVFVNVPHATSLISFDYNFSIPGVLTSADIEYVSNATASSDRIDLTVDKLWSTGRAAYGQPADGMAFFLGPYPVTLPQDSNGGFLGLVNNPNNTANTDFPPAVAVEFDTFHNHWDPNDTVNHFGVDINRIISSAYTPLPDGCFNGTMSALVRYEANSRQLSATLRFDDDLDLPGLPRLYYVTATVDFKDAGLPQNAAVGFSGATGDFIESHQILSWSFESTLTSVAVVNKTGK
ncbi:hypothetical protein U9M48_026626 [Paspalum notatum var. saurae]|uniref:Legume lectin domain-containing protein n=1 Tax=Paspalum notatum var. saurae TaxID=547442 RepID=A0AAQ3TXX1_PASNO